MRQRNLHASCIFRDKLDYQLRSLDADKLSLSEQISFELSHYHYSCTFMKQPHSLLHGRYYLLAVFKGKRLRAKLAAYY